MWAQLVKFRVPSGNDEKFRAVNDRWEEQVGRGTDSGWQRTLIFRSVSDPTEWYEIVYFESEEKARANERSPKHLELVGELMALVEREPEFIDLTPVAESTR